jgi:cytochrome c2
MEGHRGAVKAVTGTLTGGLLVIAIGLSACNRDAVREAAELTGGDPVRGQAAIRQHGCQSCHTIPGVPGADGLVGPPLGGIASRVYIAGVLPNTPANMILWIQVPRAMDERTAMPNMGVPESEARDIAAYLYTLK